MAAAETRVYQSTLGLAHAVCDQIVDIAERAITSRGRFVLGLSGGKTPKPVYEMLANPDYSDAINWNFTHVFWSDERCVPPDHVESNYRMGRDLLLNRVRVPVANFHRIHGELEPKEAADLYEADLRDFFGKRMNTARPRFDLHLLGIGEDGHTASLFPGLPAVHETEKWVVSHYVEKLDTWRVTMTPEAINAAANIYFIVTGEEKNATVKRILHDDINIDELPAQAIKPTDGRLVWYLDSAAGKGV
jgi:6-phosphogluconolactonase